jgi:predicted metalloprotease with PDZ domain
MKRVAQVLCAVTALAFAAPAFSGGGKCDQPAQACLDMMVEKYKAHGWSGFKTEKNKETHVITIKEVYPGTPAADAGFQVGDVLVAINGVKFDKDNYDAVKKAKSELKVGSKVTYTVSRAGAEQELAVTQVEVPEEMLAQWVGGHMLEHVTVAQATP